MRLLILKGLPASGKTTWARDFCSKNKDWVRVNRDDLRNMRGLYWLPKQEKLITEWEDSCIETALASGYNVILDATNLNEDRNNARVAALKEKFPVLNVDSKSFDLDVQECIRRDLIRANSVGEKVIRKFYQRYLAPEPPEYIENKLLPKCVIFDVDGTLALHNGRSPFDWGNVISDIPNEPIVELSKNMAVAGFRIIIFTGRDGVCLQDTKKWLVKHEIPFSDIFIRDAGDTRKDSIVKKELFEKHIRGKYFCQLVVDDRNQVVDMWRNELGLTCLQVDYGDF